MRRALILASMVAFVETFFYAIVGPLLPTYKAALGLGDAEVGLLSGAFAWGSAVGALPAGFLVQRFGPRRVIGVSLLVLSCASLALGWVDQVALLDLARLFQGLAATAAWIGGFALLVAATPPDRRGEAIGAANLIGILGPLVGPVVGALAATTDTGPVFAATLLLTVPLIWWVRRMEETAGFRHQPLREVISAVRTRSIVAGSVLLAVPALAFGCLSILMPLEIDSLGGGAGLIALALVGAGIIEPILGRISGSWSDRRGRREPSFVGLAIIFAGLVAMAATRSSTGVVLAYLVASLGGGLCIVPGFAMLSDAAEQAGLAQSHAFALCSTVFPGGVACGALAGGAIASAAGATSAYLAAAGAVAVLAAYVGRAPAAGIIRTLHGPR